MKLTLSPRQLEIHAAMLAGERQKAIARRLGLSVKTVYEHTSRTREKLAEVARLAEQESKRIFR